MKRVLTVAFALIAMLALAAPLAQAQNETKYKKRTVIDLTGSVIEGDLVKPEGSLIRNRKLSRFSALVTPRPDYWFELEFSSENL